MKNVTYDVLTGKTTTVDLTAEEIADFHSGFSSLEEKRTASKLEKIKSIRNNMLIKTDWLVSSEKITDAQKTWRQSLRDIPQNNTTTEQYNLILAEDEDGELTHSVWTKP